METRKNILMDVSPKPVAREPTPPPPEPVPTEQDIFKKRQEESVDKPQGAGMSLRDHETVPQISEPIAPPKKQKRACSDKMKAHLAKCREKASAKKLAARQAKERAQPPKQEQYIQSAPIDIPQHIPQEIDYDKIINGVSARMSKQREEDQYIADYEQSIRQDEREKAKKEYTGLFMDAATKFKKKTYAGFGRQTIYGNAKAFNHPVFGKQIAYNKDSKNPFDGCF